MATDFKFGPPGPIRDLPTPSGYRQLTPAVLELPISAKARFFQRKRVVIGLGVVAALHLGLALAWWLIPPLRIKADYAPERWVPLLSVPEPEAVKSTAAATEESNPPAAGPAAAPEKKNSRDAHADAARTLPQPASTPAD